MGMDQTTKVCPICQKPTLWARPGTNHILHLLITVMLCGFWLPVWILASLRIGGWRCQTCGYKGSLLSRLGVPALAFLLFLGAVSVFASRTGNNRATGRPNSPPQPTSRQEVQPNSSAIAEAANSDVPQKPAPKNDPPAEAIPASPPPASPSSKNEKQEYVERDNIHVGYTSYVVWRSWWSNQLSENQFLNQKPNAVFLFVELTVRNDDKKPRMIPPFTLLDESGAEYQASSHGWAVEGSIGLIESLNPEVKKQGFVVFDVPKNKNYRLKLSGGFWSLKDAYVQLAPKASRDGAKAAEQERKDEEARAERKRKAEEEQQADKERREADEAAKWRTWTDSAGTHKTEAKYGGMISGKVRLIRADGSSIDVPLEKLSDEDQKWIEHRKHRPNPAPGKKSVGRQTGAE